MEADIYYNVYPYYMKRIVLATGIIAGSVVGIHAQVTGMWKITDEKSNVEKSVVEIFEYNNMYHGRVIKILPTSKRTHCDECEGDLKGKPLVGMVIISDLTKTANGGVEGRILNPANGNTYSCYIELVSPNRLKLRGFLGFPAFGKTMYYNRM
jgi:uncharacterized protein (DUF2147 family)